MAIDGLGAGIIDEAVIEQVEIQAKYSGYIDRQALEIAKHQRHELSELPSNIDYSLIKGLSIEIREKLARTKPGTIGQAARIPGVTPAAISLLLVYLKKTSIVDQMDKAI